MHSQYERFTRPSEKVETRISRILSGLSLEEKIDLVGGHPTQGITKANPRAGIPELRMADASVGVHWFCTSSTTYPATILAAASWDRGALFRMGEAVGRDARARVTFERPLEDRSSYGCYHDSDNDKHVALTDSIFFGHRHVDKAGVQPLFPFGFGLSYTSFSYENLVMSSGTLAGDEALTVSFDIVNSGDREGAEVAQLYIGSKGSPLPRPVKELKGFEKVTLRAGERKRVSIPVNSDALACYNPAVHDWVCPPGEYEACIGASSTDIRLHGSFRYVTDALNAG